MNFMDISNAWSEMDPFFEPYPGPQLIREYLIEIATVAYYISWIVFLFVEEIMKVESKKHV